VNHFGIHSVAIKTTLEKLSSLKHFYVTMLGGKEIMELPGSLIFELPNNCIIELYTEISETPAYLFEKNDTVLGFRTDDLSAQYELLKAQSYTLLSPILHAGECYSFFHFLNPNNQVCMMNELHKH
jgi:hypothetical protein